MGGPRLDSPWNVSVKDMLGTFGETEMSLNYAFIANFVRFAIVVLWLHRKTSLFEEMHSKVLGAECYYSFP